MNSFYNMKTVLSCDNPVVITETEESREASGIVSHE